LQHEKIIMRHYFLLLATAAFITTSLAQTEVLNGVWVLNEGVLDWNTNEMVESASVGVYDPTTGEFADVMDFPDADFTTNIIIEGGSAFVGADNKIFKIGLDSWEVEAEVEVQGVRHIAYHDGMIYMTRGDSDPVTWGSVEFDSYLLWFDAETLEQVGQLEATEGVGFACEGISIVDGKVYVAINNGFAWAQEVGFVGVYDIVSGIYEEFDLGVEGKNPAHIKVVDGGVVTVNNTDWSATSLSRVDLVGLGAEENGVSTQYVEGVAAGCNAAAVLGEKLVFQISGEMGLRKANISDLSPVEGMWGPAEDNYYRMAVNPMNGDVYATSTLFSADMLGEVHIINSEGVLINSFDAGEVPGAIAFDIRTIQSVVGINNDEAVVIGEYDMLGKVWSTGNRGMKVQMLSNGDVRKIYVAQ